MTLNSKPPTNFIDVIPNSKMVSGGAVVKIGTNFLWFSSTGALRVACGTAAGEPNTLGDTSGASMAEGQA